MDREEWKDIEGYKGFYKVSSLGSVQSFKGKSSRVLTQVISTTGYYYVTLSEKGKTKKIKTHRLVAIAFLNELDKKETINHINGIKTDNRVNNLEWATQSENNIHAYKTGLKRITDNNKKAMSSNGVENIKKAQESNKIRTLCLNNNKIYGSIVEAAKDLGINHQAISRVVSGQRPHTHGYRFKIIKNNNKRLGTQ